ncbi:hypothetical protein PILCRDRAFT_76713 [Piloderma croceum F 1598]|uniref:LIM zinc-binding domain-containing protein n=1 Tax=Piloderma croceum (strain F 1598) TaxID=765440 RepID=A0A0C3ATY3_PILCF|nr:hypothetical protein PILCRDRAFT_76713 [Piloderma croceum F 1598]
MHPFGGTPICPRCNKSVYAAEQTMGPGRRLYHKPCLACTICNKRLDSLTLLEHDQKVLLSKTCHVKNFGIRDLRQANLPHRQDSNSTQGAHSTSPVKSNDIPFSSTDRQSISPVPAQSTGASGTRTGRTISPSSVLRPNRTLSPNKREIASTPESDELLEAVEQDDTVDDQAQFTSRARPVTPTFTGTSTNSGRTVTGFPRTVPLSPSKTGQNHPLVDQDGASSSPPKFLPATLGRSSSSTSARSFEKANMPVKQTSTGTRYGAALGGAPPSPVRQWGAGTPQCPTCSKNVYFAEQVKAIGKTWHKGCLRCTECSTLLDSTRLTEKDGNPLCHRCYGKLHGPQGGGYALLGKAGG